MKKTERFTVFIEVPSYLREYVMCTNGGSDILRPGKFSFLWCLMTQHLETNRRYVPVPKDKRRRCVQIELRNVRGKEIFSASSGKKVHLDVNCRFSLSTKGENVVRRYMSYSMKTSFRDYMMGAMLNSEFSISDAIEEFCTEYDITMDFITFDTLRKDWFRFRKRSVKNNLCSLLER